MLDSWILLTLAAVICLASFAWLALAMEPHWKKVQVGSSSAHPAKVLRIIGWSGLLVSAAICFLADRPSMAALVWIMLLAACAPSIGMLLAWRPRLLKLFWPGAN